jgi:hypothetical protein
MFYNMAKSQGSSFDNLRSCLGLELKMSLDPTFSYRGMAVSEVELTNFYSLIIFSPKNSEKFIAHGEPYCIVRRTQCSDLYITNPRVLWILIMET